MVEKPPAPPRPAIPGEPAGAYAHSHPITMDELASRMNEGFANVMGSIVDFRRETDQRFGRIEDRVEDIESTLSSEPPPPPGQAGLPTPPRAIAARYVRRRAPSLSSRTERVEGDSAELHGRLLAVESKLDTQLDINKQQSRAQGLAMPGASFREQAGKFLWSREGAKFMVAMVTALAAATATVYAAVAQREATRAADKPSTVLVVPSNSSR